MATKALCIKLPRADIIQLEASHTVAVAAAIFGVNDTLASCTWVAACNIPNRIAVAVRAANNGPATSIAVHRVDRNRSDAKAEVIGSGLLSSYKARPQVA